MSITGSPCRRTAGAVCLLLSCAGGAAAADLEAAAASPPQSAAATLLAGLCGELSSSPGVEGELGQTVCDLEDGSVSDPDARGPLQAVAWEEVAAQGGLPVEASTRQLANLGGRLRALRLGTGAGMLALDDAAGDEWSPLLLASADSATAVLQRSPSPRLGLFATAALGFGDRDPTAREDGFDFDAVALTAGADYRFTDRFVAGVALASNTVDADFDANDGEVGADGYGLSLYGSYYPGDFFVDVTATAGLTDYDMTRNIRYAVATDSVDASARSRTDGTHYALALAGGYELRRGALTFGPYAGIEYLEADIDGFRERGAGEFNLEIGDQRTTSLLSVLGAQASYAVQAGEASVLPQIRFEWRHEFDDDARSLEARLVNDPSGDVAVLESEDPDRDYFFLATGVLAVLPGGASLAAEYQTVLGLAEVTHHVVQLRARLAF